MNHKTHLSVINAAILLFALTACGETQPPAAPEEPESAGQQAEQQTPQKAVDEAVPNDTEKAPADRSR